MTQMRANQIAEHFKTALTVTGIAFGIFFLVGKGWLADKADSIVKATERTQSHLKDLLEIAEEWKKSRRS